MEVLHIESPTHGRVLVRPAPATATKADRAITIVGFHGYAQSADEMMDALERIPGADRCRLISVQALNRFYTRGDQKIVASWMTRQDREHAIADNIEYVNRALARETGELFLVGFSQGVAMAYRAALLGARRAHGVIAIGGDIPPDVKDVALACWPRVMIAAGATDHWYTAEKVSADESSLKSIGVKSQLLRYAAGHEITDDVLAAISEFTKVR